MVYTGPLNPIDSAKKDIRMKTCACLQLTDDIVGKYRSEEDLTEEEAAEGYNSSVKISFKIVEKSRDIKLIDLL